MPPRRRGGWGPVTPTVDSGIDEPMEDRRNLGHTFSNVGPPVELADFLQQAAPMPKMFRVSTTDHNAAPVDGAPGGPPTGVGGTLPDVNIDVCLPFEGGEAFPTTSFLVLLTAPVSSPPAAASSGGFQVTVWMRDRRTLQWGTTDSFFANYREWWTTGDFNGGELYFQITNVAADGVLEIHTLEQS